MIQYLGHLGMPRDRMAATCFKPAAAAAATGVQVTTGAVSVLRDATRLLRELMLSLLLDLSERTTAL